jgi:hypothetical protein
MSKAPEEREAKHRRELNVPSPVVGLIAILFTGAMLWNIAIKGDSMVTIALATAVPFIIGVPIGSALLRGGSGGS